MKAYWFGLLTLPALYVAAVVVGIAVAATRDAVKFAALHWRRSGPPTADWPKTRRWRAMWWAIAPLDFAVAMLGEWIACLIEQFRAWRGGYAIESEPL